MQQSNSFFNIRAYYALAVLTCLLLLPSLSDGQITYTITDRRDGQTYKVVRIDDKWWMAQNLNVGIMINSTVAQSNTNGVIEKYCPNNSEDACRIYGGLYQWNELMGFGIEFDQGICPGGWYVPSDAAWKTLEQYLGMSSLQTEYLEWRGTDEGGKLKANNPSFWTDPDSCNTDESGFSALPAGCVTPAGVYTGESLVTYFYCSDAVDDAPWFRLLYNTNCQIYRNYGIKEYANSARCVKFSPNIFDGGILKDTRDDKQYSTVLIGNHWWMAENLNVGTWIDLIGDQTDNGLIQKYCYNNVGSNCDDYGGLYQWNEMMNYDAVNKQGICPYGWHIPTDNEWKELEYAVGMAAADLDKTGWQRGTNQGLFLKAGGGSGFEALLGGMIDANGYSNQQSANAFIWTSDPLDTKYSWSRVFQAELLTVYRNSKSNRQDALSVRCIEDQNAVLTLTVNTIDTLCTGEEFAVRASTLGGSSSKSFSWTSDPPGFFSTDSVINNITANTNTKYTVRVIDGYIYTQDSVTVIVKPAPAIGLTGVKEVCPSLETEYLYTDTVTGNTGNTYEWDIDGTLTTGTNSRWINWGLTPGDRNLGLTVTDLETGCSSGNNITVEVLQASRKPVIILKGEHLLICPDSGLVYQWYKNNVAIEGANRQFYYTRDNKPGSFSIEVKIEGQCTSASDPYSVELKSAGDLDDDELQTTFIRPVPAKGNIYVDMINEYTGQVHLIITNILGRTVKQHTLYKNSEIYCTQIDLGELAAGSYLLLIQYGTGKEVHRIVLGN